MDDPFLLLRKGDYSLVVSNRGETRTFSQRGVADLYGLLKEEPDFLHGASVADKVTGKAAAALMILGGIREIHTGVISRLALDLLHKNGIPVRYEQETPYIINRTQTDWCPLETRCRNLQTPQECLIQIENFMDTFMKPNA